MAFVKTEVQGAVEIITIDRPKALNALNPEVLADLKAAFEAVDQETIRCIVLTGEGDKSFVAGADIGSMSTMTKAEGEAFGKLGNDVFLMIESFPIPVIAAVNGFALGGGNELAMSCDIRICSDNAVFGQPEVGLGITPGFGGTQRLARLVGMGMAKQLVYSALNIKADEAYRIGLVNAVYTQEELMPAALKLAGKSDKKDFIVVFTDGEPDDKAAAAKVIIDAANSQETDDALTILFVQVGDDAGATKYLRSLDDDLTGAKFDIVDAKTVAEADAFPTTAALILAAIED